MAIKQLSVYIENTRGALADVTGAIAAAGVNCRSMCIADTKEYGVLRIISDDHEKALKALRDSGFTASVRDVVGFEVPDSPGGLAGVLRLLDENDINLEYLYAMIPKTRPTALIVMRVDDNEKTEKLLADNGVKVIEGMDQAI